MRLPFRLTQLRHWHRPQPVLVSPITGTAGAVINDECQCRIAETSRATVGSQHGLTSAMGPIQGMGLFDDYRASADTLAICNPLLTTSTAPPLWTSALQCLLRERDSVLRGLAISSVNLSANECYGALINRSRIPCLDGREIGFPRLVSCTGAPAMSLEEICC
jgi:hypothetical protein